MKRQVSSALVLVSMVAVAGGCRRPADRAVARSPETASAGEQTRAIVKAATAVLESLDAAQRGRVVFPLPPASGKPTAAPFKGGVNGRMTFVGEQYGDAVWSNYPVSDVPGPGLQLGSLSAVQRDAALRLVQTMLSPEGFRKVLDILGSDQALANAGTRFSAGTDVYTLGIFGAPSAASPWMIQFGGHHLAHERLRAGVARGGLKASPFDT